GMDVGFHWTCLWRSGERASRVDSAWTVSFRMFLVQLSNISEEPVRDKTTIVWRFDTGPAIRLTSLAIRKATAGARLCRPGLRFGLPFRGPTQELPLVTTTTAD